MNRFQVMPHAFYLALFKCKYHSELLGIVIDNLKLQNFKVY